MSVYRPKRRDGTFKTDFFHYDFVARTPDGQRRRFHGSTGQRTRTAAKRFEDLQRRLAGEGKLSHAMSLEEGCVRYMGEVTNRQTTSDDTETSLEHLCRLVGKETPMVLVDSGMLADAVRKRSAERVVIQTRKGPVEKQLVSGATVNRQIVETARRLLNRARKVWKMPVEADIPWSDLKLPERTRTRPLTTLERSAYLAAIRQDLRPIVLAYLLTGVRRAALCGLLKSAVDFELDGFTIMLKRKRGEEPRPLFIPFTAETRSLFKAEMAKSPVPQVFTYERQIGRLKGHRIAVGYSSFRKAHEAARIAAGIPEFRFHDARHDMGTDLLRKTGNLRLVQRALGHADIASTARYAQVLDDDLRAGLAVFTSSRNGPGATVNRETATDDNAMISREKKAT